jgi:hypothetical protein
MARPQLHAAVSIGDPMPRITLPLATGGLFDSWDPMTSGQAHVYWVGLPPSLSAAAQLAEELAGRETLLHIVTPTPPQQVDANLSWLLDPAGELGRAFGAAGSLAIVVDAGGRVALLQPQPTPDAVETLVTCIYRASTATIVRAKAPVLLLERVVDPSLGEALIEYWQSGSKIANEVASDAGNTVNADIKRRQDVRLDDPTLFVQLRDCLVRRVVPTILQAFHTRINVIEAPLIGCYGAGDGWFRRHRDNTSRSNAHRQFAISVNLNEDYDGGEVRFPEFGRELYRPVMGGAVVFSCSLLHEALPVTRGRRLGAFTFLSTSGPAASTGPAPRR